MKAKSVKTKINQLIRALGSRKAVAKKLYIDVSYVTKLKKGLTPGPRLYRDICELIKEISK
jgi:hypothetical protein